MLEGFRGFQKGQVRGRSCKYNRFCVFCGNVSARLAWTYAFKNLLQFLWGFEYFYSFVCFYLLLRRCFRFCFDSPGCFNERTFDPIFLVSLFMFSLVRLKFDFPSYPLVLNRALDVIVNILYHVFSVTYLTRRKNWVAALASKWSLFWLLRVLAWLLKRACDVHRVRLTLLRGLHSDAWKSQVSLEQVEFRFWPALYNASLPRIIKTCAYMRGCNIFILSLWLPKHICIRLFSDLERVPNCLFVFPEISKFSFLLFLRFVYRT